MNSKIDFNNNTNECVHYKMNVGSTEYVNICTGDISYVSWGACDWMGFGFLAVAGLVVLIFFTYMLIDSLRQ